MDNGEKILDELSDIIQKCTTELAKQDSETIQEGLLTIHRVILVLLEVHENTMIECGFTQEDLKYNLEILEKAKNIVEDEFDLRITMPGGDA